MRHTELADAVEKRLKETDQRTRWLAIRKWLSMAERHLMF
jgi:hypothetical protein